MLCYLNSSERRISTGLKHWRLRCWCSAQPVELSDQGPVSRKSRRLFGPEKKPFIKLWLAFSVKLVFSYVVKGIKIKITAMFRASRRLRFEDTKRIVSPEIHPKSFGTFEKQAPAQWELSGHVRFNYWNFIRAAVGNNFNVNDLRSYVMLLELNSYLLKGFVFSKIPLLIPEQMSLFMLNFQSFERR